NAAGPSALARSARSAVVAQGSRHSTSIASPTDVGEAREGQTLTATAGEWSGAPTSFAYQWLRCDAGGANCNPVEAATASSYQVAGADVGSARKSVVKGKNGARPAGPARGDEAARGT